MKYGLLTGMALWFGCLTPLFAQQPIVPSHEELSAVFGKQDKSMFLHPSKIYYPETWFHYIEGNVDKAGITADLEAIAAAGISGIQLFHGSGNAWPGVKEQICSLSARWDEAVQYTAKEAQRMGLRFTMQNCPGWAMSGGPWIEPSNAMRHLVWSRTDLKGGVRIQQNLPLPDGTDETWRDYKEVAVLAFPTPMENTNKVLLPSEIKSDLPDLPWRECVEGRAGCMLPPVSADRPHWIELTFDKAETVRSVEFSSINRFYHDYCYEPGVSVAVQALSDEGAVVDILQAEMPQSNWQDDSPITLACHEAAPVKRYRISIVNQHPMHLSMLHLYSDARKNNWEAEAAWTLRSLMPANDHPRQSKAAFVDGMHVLDLTSQMDRNGRLNWMAPEGNWTVLRIGHVNTGMKNGPAPQEATGWECNKLSESGADVHFANYIGRLADGPLQGGLLNGMLLDSWECSTQTWTEEMEKEFFRISGYELRKWLPALFGYVINDHETTSRFLRDWRGVINELYVHKFYARMVQLAKEKGLNVAYETAAGDVFPADIMEYFKYADVPMCEFWQHSTNTFVGSLNFKPIKPTVSAARLYGKPRVSAEAFTSFQLTWDEHLEMLKESANMNFIEGVTHPVFHTYTHNPCADSLVPGTSFGGGIGTPFLRGQTWWKHLPAFTDYLARCTYLLERGVPVSDVLWYLGDEINHKPDQWAAFPHGFKYDYCNPDVLLHRLEVHDGLLVTPEGVRYRVLWMPDTHRMLPETLEKVLELVRAGATVIGEAPDNPATLSSPDETRQRFDAAVTALWGDCKTTGVHAVGKGCLVTGLSLEEALQTLKLQPDVIGGEALWLHRQIEGADWYYVCAPKGRAFQGDLSFRSSGSVEIWDPLTGKNRPAHAMEKEGRTVVSFDLAHAGSCFVVFKHDGRRLEKRNRVKDEDVRVVWNAESGVWTLNFADGWGVSAPLKIRELKAWRELGVNDEAKAYSGTVTYKTIFKLDKKETHTRYMLDLGHVEMIAKVTVNGNTIQTLWTPPYRADITEALRKGDNELRVEVTSSWYNRLVYDANQPEALRKTWTINGPSKDAVMKPYGLLGPVKIEAVR